MEKFWLEHCLYDILVHVIVYVHTCTYVLGKLQCRYLIAPPIPLLQDDDTPTSTPLTLKGSTNPPFDASSSPVIGPKETAVDTPMSVADLSNNHAPKPSSMLPQTHPSLDQHGLPQDMLQSVQYPPQTSYSEEDFHRWFYKDPQGVMQGT